MAARLYQFRTSPYCAKVRKILDFKGIAYEVIEVDYLERKELLQASGQLFVPALTLDGGETIVDSARIALRLEELVPEPTILPVSWRGLHLALAEYLDNQVEELIFRARLPYSRAYFRAQGRDREALWRLVREKKYGAGFIDRTIAEHDLHLKHACELLAYFDSALEGKAFLLGRIGLADFALYGQLNSFTFTGQNRIPAKFANLRAFFDRIDRITSKLQPE